jgi:hypothetical protein
MGGKGSGGKITYNLADKTVQSIIINMYSLGHSLDQICELYIKCSKQTLLNYFKKDQEFRLAMDKSYIDRRMYALSSGYSRAFPPPNSTSKGDSMLAKFFYEVIYGMRSNTPAVAVQINSGEFASLNDSQKVQKILSAIPSMTDEQLSTIINGRFEESEEDAEEVDVECLPEPS